LEDGTITKGDGKRGDGSEDSNGSDGNINGKGAGIKLSNK
jgi:hypothetical protein